METPDISLRKCVHTSKGARHGGSPVWKYIRSVSTKLSKKVNLLLLVGNGVSVVEWWGLLSGMIEALGSIPATGVWLQWCHDGR